MKNILALTFLISLLTTNTATASTGDAPQCPSLEEVKAIAVSPDAMECIEKPSTHYLSSGFLGSSPGKYLLSASWASSMPELEWNFDLYVYADTIEEAAKLAEEKLASLTHVSSAQQCCFNMHWSCSYGAAGSFDTDGQAHTRIMQP